MSDRVQETYDPRYDNIYQRGGTGDAGARLPSPAARPPALPREPERTVEPGIIREVGPEPTVEPDGGLPARNPFDVWIWVVAAVLTGLGFYLLTAPMIHEQSFMDGQGLTSPYSMPWFNYTGMAAAPLILLGIATAVVQLFLLSVRHTLRSR